MIIVLDYKKPKL